MIFSQLKTRFSVETFYLQIRLFSVNSRLQNNTGRSKRKVYSENVHCYKNIFPWNCFSDFANHLTSSIVYNKDGLIALNKPFGIKVHGHDKPGTRSKTGQRSIFPTISECDYTIEDALGNLKDFLNVPHLSLLKSAEKYTSGLVLLSANEKVTADVKKSFNLAKIQKRSHLIHWMVTLGYPAVNFKEERVGIKFLEVESIERKQPVIVSEMSKNACKRKEVYPVRVQYRVISVNKTVDTSLVEISTSSVKWHFVRVYASSHIASILGDILYSNRMNTLLGAPIKLHLQQAQAFDLQPLSDKMSQALGLPRGVDGHSRIPTMLHLRSIVLPSYRGEDLVITAKLPAHFQWTTEKLNLLSSCNEIK